MHRAWQILSLTAVLLGGSACLKWPGAEVSSKQPDKALFDAAVLAAERDRFTVANLILQTLVNTYPDCEYARKAELLLQDPRIGACSESWSSSAQCDERRTTISPTD